MSLLTGNVATIAGTVYGTIVVLATLTAGAQAHVHDLWKLVAIATVTVLVFSVAHVYAHGLSESLQVGRRLTGTELADIAKRELSIPLSAVLPLACVALGAAGIVRERTSLWLAFGVGLAALAVQGVRYARLEQLSRVGTTVTVALNLALGLVLIVMKALISH